MNEIRLRIVPLRSFAVVLAAVLGGLAPLPSCRLAANDSNESAVRVYVGTYTRGDSQGIYQMLLDPETGALTEPALAGRAVNPSFVALHPERNLLYAVGEVGDFGGQRSGAVYAFRIDPQTGQLSLLNTRPSSGPTACHISLDPSGRYVLIANYSDGSASVLPLQDDGSLGEATARVQHEGSGADPRRQRGPHAHWIQVDPANRFALVADLGLDRVMIYRFDPTEGTLEPNDPPWASLAPGAGPRHAAFHPSSDRVYVINELNSTVTAFSYDRQRGAMEEIHTVSTLPEDFSGDNTTAEILVHPSGRFLYGSNRGHDSIAVFAIDPETGRLQAVEHESTQGSTPRNFGIDPAGRYLLAANQASDSIVVFRIDSSSGKLTPTGHRASVSMPVCIRMQTVER